jgi:lipopolysaccharide export system protein LptA
MAAETTRRVGKTDGALYILKKIIYLLIALFISGATTAICDELGGLKVYKARLPIYNKKRLQYMIFCAVMTRKADKIYADDAIIDLVKNNIDVNKIKYLEDVKPYKLGTSPVDVAEFWKDKTNTLGFISSSKATIIQESKVASGNEKVFFRSPQLDLNGIGFTANFDTRIIKVLQDVDIIVRMNSGKKDKTGKKISKGNIVKVKADSMIMNMKQKVITLIGNVKVDDAGFDIFCSRLILDLNKEDDDVKKDDKKDSDNTINPNGVSNITCLGKVKIIRKISAEEIKKNGAQTAFADKAVYNTSNEQITLTGENPQIHHGDNMISGKKIIIWKNSERLQAFKNCLVETIDKKAAKPKKTVLTSNFIDFDYANNLGIFTGNVRVKNAEFKLNCNKMDVHLQKKGAGSGKKEINKIICTGTVIINDPRAQVNCNRMVISFKDSVPGGKKSKVDIDGGGKREVDLIKCFGNVHMLNKPENIEEKPTIISSNDAVLNIPGNVADLIGNVKIEESRFYLTCEKMKLIAKEVTPEKAAANVAANQENPDMTPKHIGIGDSRELIKIICLEKVIMTRKLSYETQKACGDKGVYIINDHQITLTSTTGKPTLQRGPTIMEGNKIILWTDSEQLDVEEGTLKGFTSDGL